MAAALFNLLVPKGADYRRVLLIEDSLGDPVSFSGDAAFHAEIREKHGRPLAAELTFKTKNGWGTDTAGTTDATLDDGQVAIILPRAESARLESGRNYQWDFFFTDSSGFVDKLLYGSVTVDPSITNLPIP